VVLGWLDLGTEPQEVRPCSAPTAPGRSGERRIWEPDQRQANQHDTSTTTAPTARAADAAPAAGRRVDQRRGQQRTGDQAADVPEQRDARDGTLITRLIAIMPITWLGFTLSGRQHQQAAINANTAPDAPAVWLFADANSRTLTEPPSRPPGTRR